MNALDRLIEHAQEKYPHFESERGQADIEAAKQEHAELVQALVGFHFRFTRDNIEERKETRLSGNGVNVFITYKQFRELDDLIRRAKG